MLIVSMPFEVVKKLVVRFRGLVSVKGNHFNDFINHKLFHLFFGLVLELNLKL